MPRSFVTFLVLVLLFATSRPAAARGAGLAPDKALHFSVCLSFAVLGSGLSLRLSDDWPLALLIGGGLGVGAAAGKEIWDSAGHGDASLQDFGWGMVGTAAGLSLLWVLGETGGQAEAR